MESLATASVVFDRVWSALVDLLGTCATAALVRRAAHQGSARYPELEGLVVTRDALGYGYQLPPAWKAARRSPALAHLVRQELFPLLRALTGDLVVRRLERMPELAAAMISSLQEERHG